MTDETIRYEGGCNCGAVKVTVTGNPRVSGYCHCESCRRWHAAPINAWAAWPGDAVAIEQGEEKLVRFDTREQGGANVRCECGECGSGVMNQRHDGLTVVYSSALYGIGFKHEPTMHIHYQERVLDVNDGLPKFADSPAEFGGSGEMIEEPASTGPAA